MKTKHVPAKATLFLLIFLSLLTWLQGKNDPFKLGVVTSNKHPHSISDHEFADRIKKCSKEQITNSVFNPGSLKGSLELSNKAQTNPDRCDRLYYRHSRNHDGIHPYHRTSRTQLDLRKHRSYETDHSRKSGKKNRSRLRKKIWHKDEDSRLSWRGSKKHDRSHDRDRKSRWSSKKHDRSHDRDRKSRWGSKKHDRSHDRDRKSRWGSKKHDRSHDRDRKSRWGSKKHDRSHDRSQKSWWKEHDHSLGNMITP